MDVVFYTFAKRDNSTKRPAGGTTFNCVLKDSSGVLSPQIEISTTGNPRSYNYAYIPDFGRYYYVAEWTYFRGTWTASLRVDVLASWKDSIGASSQYILRAADETIWDEYILDNKYPASTEMSYSYSQAADDVYDSSSLVLGVITSDGTAGTRGAAKYYALTSGEAAAIFNWLIGDSYDSYIESLGRAFSGVVDDLFRATYNPMQFIVSAKWFPFTVIGMYHTMYVGKLSTGMQVRDLMGAPDHSFSTTFTIPKHPLIDTRGKYLSSAPFSFYVLEFQPFGRIEIDGSMLSKFENLRCDGTVDLISGESILYVTAYNDGGTSFEIGSYSCKMGADVAIGQATSNVLQNTVVSLGRAAANAAAENWFGVADAAISAVTDLRTQMNGRGCEGSFLPQGLRRPRLNLYYHNVPNRDVQQFGLPVCGIYQISSVGIGYVQCATGDVEAPATLTELESIKGYLISGFYYE